MIGDVKSVRSYLQWMDQTFSRDRFDLPFAFLFLFPLRLTEKIPHREEFHIACSEFSEISVTCDHRLRLGMRLSTTLPIWNEAMPGKNLLWRLVDDPMSRNGKKRQILVAWLSRGSGLGKLCAAFPLFDVRDANADGSVSWLESGFTAYGHVDSLFGMMANSTRTGFLQTAALAVKDYEYYTQVTEAALKNVFSVAREQFTALTISRLIGAGSSGTLNVVLEGIPGGGATCGVINSAAEALVKMAIIKSSFR